MILLDTHALVWLMSDPTRLSSGARAAVAQASDAGEGLAVADITLWEITVLVAHGRLQLGILISNLLAEIEKRYVMCRVTSQVCLRALTLPADYPRDPADRIIGATALVEGMQLVTADAAIRKSNAVPTIW